jgi:hypothetical protein
MKITDSILQDLNDILYLNFERSMAYNVSAYSTTDLHLKGLLNRETDNARENVTKLKILVADHFGLATELAPTNQLLSQWSDLRTLFSANNFGDQLEAFEMADLIMIQYYSLALSRVSLDAWIKNLLDFQHHNGLALYTAIKSFREAHLSNKFRSQKVLSQQELSGENRMVTRDVHN